MVLRRVLRRGSQEGVLQKKHAFLESMDLLRTCPTLTIFLRAAALIKWPTLRNTSVSNRSLSECWSWQQTCQADQRTRTARHHRLHPRQGPPLSLSLSLSFFLSFFLSFSLSLSLSFFLSLSLSFFLSCFFFVLSLSLCPIHFLMALAPESAKIRNRKSLRCSVANVLFVG